jgi:hypothetical protein
MSTSSELFLSGKFILVLRVNATHYCSQVHLISRIKTCFRYLWCGLFLTCRKKKIIRHIYTTLQMFMTFLLCYTINIVVLELLGMWLVVVWMGHSVPRLIAYWFLPAPFPLARVFIDTCTVLSTGTAWLDLPSSITVLERLDPVWVSGSLAYAH